jgi:hypothetical protein
MPSAILKSRIYPFRVAAGIKEIAFGQYAVDEIGFFHNEGLVFKGLLLVSVHFWAFPLSREVLWFW